MSDAVWGSLLAHAGAPAVATARPASPRLAVRSRAEPMIAWGALLGIDFGGHRGPLALSYWWAGATQNRTNVGIT